MEVESDICLRVGGQSMESSSAGTVRVRQIVRIYGCLRMLSDQSRLGSSWENERQICCEIPWQRGPEASSGGLGVFIGDPRPTCTGRTNLCMRSEWKREIPSSKQCDVYVEPEGEVLWLSVSSALPEKSHRRSGNAGPGTPVILCDVMLSAIVP